MRTTSSICSGAELSGIWFSSPSLRVSRSVGSRQRGLGCRLMRIAILPIRFDESRRRRDRVGSPANQAEDQAVQTTGGYRNRVLEGQGVCRLDDIDSVRDPVVSLRFCRPAHDMLLLVDFLVQVRLDVVEFREKSQLISGRFKGFLNRG